MDFSRLKIYDYGVIGAFILTLIGVSVNWYALTAEVLDQTFSEGLSGWHYALGVFAFVFALLALVVVLVKLLLAPAAALPSWYKEGVFLIGLGGLIALFALIAIIDLPLEWEFLGGGRSAGVFITLVAGVILVVCGAMAYLSQPLVSRRDGRATAPAAAQHPAASAGRAASYCQGCGAPLDAQSKFCRNCGRPR